jgi:glycosyltransferase involved in cell wall biosynthesis
MKIGIYQEPSSGFGGSEFVAAVMARTLRARGDVEIVHHRSGFGAAELEAVFGLDLAGVAFRHVPRPDGHAVHGHGPLLTAGRYWRRWNAAVSAPYDLFVANVHGIPPFCHARTGVLHTLFPLFDRTTDWPWGFAPRPGLRGVKDRVRRRMYERAWAERMASYPHRLAISQYSALWTERYWGVKSAVLYPPVVLPDGHGPKADAIVGLGRIDPWKDQHELIAAFTRHVAPRAPGWEFVIVGGLSGQADHRAYFADLQERARGFPVRFVVNASPEAVRAELSRAKVFWHGMGIGAACRAVPHRAEHFGIAVVEAMGAGCVPVVADRGGPAEVVRDGQCGFVP